MNHASPGTFQLGTHRVGRFAALWPKLDAHRLVIVDENVMQHVQPALKQHAPEALEIVKAGESLKSLRRLEALAKKQVNFPRFGTVIAIGGGTVGDFSTVFAHLLKRGTSLIHVPSTTLAAVDSSLGGKGALNVGGVKNALGVFHSPDETWLCEELFTTLTATQVREGLLEAWKMVVTLDGKAFSSWERKSPTLTDAIHVGRKLKSKICSQDPYERIGIRVVLNFGHTFGHAFETLTHHRLRHGAAVGLGMLCALDIGVHLGTTPADVAERIEHSLPNGHQPRARLMKLLQGTSFRTLEALLKADKKSPDGITLRMVMVTKPGHWVLRDVTADAWRPCFQAWQRGVRSW